MDNPQQQVPATITILKLINGEEVIGKVTEYESHFEVGSPMTVYKSVDQTTGQMQIAMAEYAPYGHSGIGVMRTGVVTIIVPKKEMTDQYCELTGEIILPSTQIIKG